MKPLLHVYIPTAARDSRDLLRCVTGLAAQSLGRENFSCTVVFTAAAGFEGRDELAALLPQIEFLGVEKIGLLNARDAVLRENDAPLICSVDDDNILDRDYLRLAVDFMRAHSEVGMLGGKILPEFEVEPPAHFRKHDGILALRDFGDRVLISDDAANGRRCVPGVAPIGAGMVIRREVALAFLAARDRGEAQVDGTVGGKKVPGCEDAEITYYGTCAGYEAAYDPRLVLTHLVPARRVQREAFHAAAYTGAVGWSRFRVDHGMLEPVPAWTVPLRKARAWFVHRAWTEEGHLDWLMSCGTFEGMKRRASGGRPAVARPGRP